MLLMWIGVETLEEIRLFEGFSLRAIIEFILATPVQFWLGFPFYKSAFKALRHKTANMDVLIVLGTSSSYLYSVIVMILTMVDKKFTELALFFDIAVILISFVLLGRWLENLAKGKASEAITKLLSLQPPTALLLVSDEKFVGNFLEQEIPLTLLQKGDLLKVVPGSKIPTDGVVVSGTSSVDESMITGESMPVSKKISDSVLGGKKKKKKRNCKSRS